jgi:cytochrome c-type biogenesis protein CcmH/NrfF
MGDLLQTSGSGATEASRSRSARAHSSAPARRWFRSAQVWLKAGQALALAIAVCFSLGASDPAARFQNLNHRLMCTCGCAQILGECNHVGCPNSSEELDLLRSGMAEGNSDQKIFDTFAAKYGATVLAAPPASGFNLVAWIAPFAVFAAALLGTILLVRHWTIGKSELAVQTADPQMDALRERIRRETGEEGGY